MYTAHCFEKLLILKQSDGTAVVTTDDLQPHLTAILNNLFNALKVPGSEENEYVMKAILRSMSMMKEKVVPFSDTLLEQLATKLTAVSQNPRKPHFNHYLFESICCTIRFSCKVNPLSTEKFETTLFSDY